MNMNLTKFKRIFCLGLILGQLILMLGCSNFFHRHEKPNDKVWNITYFQYFDTVSNIYSYAGDTEEEFSKNCDLVSTELQTYHQLFDIYHEYSGIVNLCTINKNAGGEPQKVDDRLIKFLKYTKELYALTNGKMNVMLGAVLRPWHDTRTNASDDPKNAKIPTMEVLEEAAKHIDINLLDIDEANKTVRIKDPKASIDVGAVGKGYATEQAAKVLEQKGCKSYVLNIGGNIRIVGTKSNGDGWTTGIKDPNNPYGGYVMYLKIADTSCVTSGVYERYFMVNGVRYHHIIDEKTLMPANYFISLTVITKDSGLADALSTALFCMTYEEGLALVNTLENVDVLWIYSDGTQKYTKGIVPIDPNKNK